VAAVFTPGEAWVNFLTDGLLRTVVVCSYFWCCNLSPQWLLQNRIKMGMSMGMGSKQEQRISADAPDQSV
jgi:hypothetical protein